MPESIDVGTHGVSRRVLLRGAGVMVPGLVLATAVGGTAAAASTPAPRGAVQAAFSASGYSWTSLSPGEQAAAPASGVVFELTAGGRPAADRRVRFSISSFDAVAGSIWFEAASGRKSVERRGYLDLDTDASGTVVLDRWLRRGPVSTAAIAARPVLRAQLVGSETILVSARLSVI